MELSMKRSGIACCEKVFEYAMPVEQATETVVPDTMPDVERILCAEGMVLLENNGALPLRRLRAPQRTRLRGPRGDRAGTNTLHPPRKLCTAV